jgi:hypothetical protein
MPWLLLTWYAFALWFIQEYRAIRKGGDNGE